MRKIPGFIMIFFLIPALLAQEEISEEVIEGEYRGKIEERKPEADLEFDIFKIIEMINKEGTHIYDRELREKSEIASTPLPALFSKQIRKPWLAKIVETPIGVFHPLYGESVEKWELVITNASGEIFSVISGKGRPPERIKWDGKDKFGNMIDPGTDYSYYVKAIDRLGNESRILGKKISIPGIVWKEGAVLNVRLDGRRVFETNRTSVTGSGLRLLEESADYVREAIDKRVKIVVYSKNDQLSENRAIRVANFIVEKVIMPEGAVTRVAGYKSAGEMETDRIDIIVR